MHRFHSRERFECSVQHSSGFSRSPVRTTITLTIGLTRRSGVFRERQLSARRRCPLFAPCMPLFSFRFVETGCTHTHACGRARARPLLFLLARDREKEKKGTSKGTRFGAPQLLGFPPERPSARNFARPNEAASRDVRFFPMSGNHSRDKSD